MRELLAIVTLLNFVLASDIGLNLPCNRELDGLLAVDPDGNPSAFLACQSSGSSSMGYWERKVCPGGMIFDFLNQQCQERKYRKPPVMNIAILNNSCAHGETCIGGTVCDQERLRCLCPYGTIPQLETLSCIKPQTSYYQETPTFNSFGNYEKTPSAPNAFMPNPSQAGAMPNFFGPNSFNFGNGNPDGSSNNFNSNDNKYSNTNFATNGGIYENAKSHGGVESVNWNGGMAGTPSNGFHGGAGFGDRNGAEASAPFVFKPNFLATTVPTTTTTKGVPMMAGPGQSCRENQVCTGGSICTFPIALCLCPGELEEKDGECVLPPTAAIPIAKVGIGAPCSELAECDYGATCVMGRCACVEPLVQHEGRCVLRQERKEVGPGELCENGEICIYGSVCDSVIPVCVCPPGTDLKDGECVSVAAISRKPALTYLPRTLETSNPPTVPTMLPPFQPRQHFVSSTTSVPVYTPSPIQPQPQPNQSSQPTHSYSQSPFGGQVQSQNTYQEKPQPSHTVPPNQSSYFSYQSSVSPALVRPASKPNQMKISQGGSKQSGVGVQCSLNTDCMIGAYCNGNTQPPTCQCLSTHVNIEGRCERVIYPGQVGCHSDLQCTAAYTGTSCVDRTCVCPRGFKEVDHTCVSASEPITSPPGGSCTDGRMCVGGSICREGWCICPDATMIVRRGICIQPGPRPTLPPSSAYPYPSLQQTYQPSGDQYGNQGQLPQPTSGNHGTMQNAQGRKIAAGANCGPFDTCVGSATCVDGLCVCPSGMHPSPQGRCEPSAVTTSPSTSSAYILSPGSAHAVKLTYYHTPQPSLSQNDECAAIGLYCRSNTVCRNLSCQCPDDYVLHHDGCVPQHETGRKKARGKARHQGTPTYARPGQKCANGEICVAGSNCNEKGICACPAEKPVLQGDECVPAPQYRSVATPGESCDQNTICTEESSCQSGQCRCKYGFIAVSGHCVALPVPTTPAMKNVVLAKPLDSCDNGEQCEGGSSCDEDTGVCMCPPGHIVFGVQCQLPPTANQAGMSPLPSSMYPTPSHTQSVTSQPSHSQPSTNECKDDTNCGENKVCVMGRCKCKPGFVDHDGVCKALEEIEIGERPVPVSFAKHKMETMMSQRIIEQDESTDSTTPQTTLRTPSRQETQRPRIIGPPIRRPRPKPKSTSSGGSGSYKTGSSGSGNCPPGNEATRDDSGRLIMCNGFEPNCPPRSYCYITTGGFASEEYNCCKSW